MNSEWREIPEDEGLTLGPEEALAREIQKTKSLKVERLKLRDDIEKLQSKNQSLEQAVERLERENQTHKKSSGKRETSNKSPSPFPTGKTPPLWLQILLVINFLACAWLIHAIGIFQ